MKRFYLNLFFWSTLILIGNLFSEPFYVDIKPVATRNFEDDGIAGNGQGGWSDEGVNDMFIYPPVEFGENSRNGYKFKILNNEDNQGKNVILLKGGEGPQDLPEQVTLQVPDKKGKYLYFIQNSVGNIKKPDNYLQALYTVKYSDGTEEKIEMHHGKELRHWWTGSWWDNSGASAWPVFVGQNHYAKKWSQFIGLWATQWENPHPNKAISSITLKSMGKANPAIFAVTIDDDDYAKSTDLKKHFVRPADTPNGYFDEKLKKEQEFLFEELIQEKHAQGIRSIDMYSLSLLAVTIDCAIVGGSGLGEKKAASVQKSENFSIISPNDPAYKTAVTPSKVGRKSINFNTVSTKNFPNNQLYMHTYYLQLPTPMKNGCEYKVTVSALDKDFNREVEVKYKDNATTTPAIKINQAAYSSIAEKRYAYLGWWAADLDKVDYSAYKKFKVIDVNTEKNVLDGDITLRRGENNSYDDKNPQEKDVSGEDVYQMDISKLTSGHYYIFIPGLGRSDSFFVGKEGMKNVYSTVMRAFLHQRCGCELTQDITDFPREACCLKNYENGHLIGKDDHPESDDKIREFRGGYHDAGDTDVFYSHLMATFKTLLAYNTCPKAFADKELNIPESGDGIPDILNEAAWGLKFYSDTQLPDGAIYAGRANDQDYSYKNWKDEFKIWKKENSDWKKYGDLPPYGNFFPCAASANTFAATASYYSKAIRVFDPKKADIYLEKAEKAYSWAKQHNKTGYEQAGISYGRLGWKLTSVWAAACLFDMTGKNEYNQDFVHIYNEYEKDLNSKNMAEKAAKDIGERRKAGTDFGIMWKGDKLFALLPYATCKRPDVNKTIQSQIIKQILTDADKQYEFTMNRHAYRMGHFRERGSWGQLSGGGVSGKNCILGYLLTGEQKYLDAASINADFQLGANPLSRTFITGLGYRPPIHPQLHDWLYNGTDNPSAGIPVYGLASPSISQLGEIYPQNIPGWRSWLDNRTKAMYSEFDMGSQIADHALLYCLLWAGEYKNE